MLNAKLWTERELSSSSKILFQEPGNSKVLKMRLVNIRPSTSFVDAAVFFSVYPCLVGFPSTPDKFDVGRTKACKPPPEVSQIPAYCLVSELL